MLKGRELLGLPVVTLNDQEQIGEVKDIIYDPYQNKILGYIIDSGGWIKCGKGFQQADVIRRTEEGLVIENRSVIRSLNAIPELRNAKAENPDVRGLRVESANGRYLGIIQDLVVEDASGEITGYEISDGVIQDLLDGRSTISNLGLSICQDRVITPEGENDLSTVSKGESL